MTRHDVQLFNRSNSQIEFYNVATVSENRSGEWLVKVTWKKRVFAILLKIIEQFVQKCWRDYSAVVETQYVSFCYGKSIWSSEDNKFHEMWINVWSLADHKKHRHSMLISEKKDEKPHKVNEHEIMWKNETAQW